LDSTDQPYEFWRDQARQEVDRLKRQRLPRAASNPDAPTLEEVMQEYFDARPELKERSIESYCSEIRRGFRYQLAQPITALTRAEILRLDREHRATLKNKDPTGRPPKGTYSWSGSLRALRTIIRWWAATQNLPSPWPKRKALKIPVPKARELPHELNSVEGRQKLVDGLRAIDSTSARACLFVAYTGLRRKEATLLAASNLTPDSVLQ
jgi:hypothetical protein